MSLKNKRIVDPVLTELTLGFKSPGLIGTMILQEVPVLKEGGTIPKFGKEYFRDFGTERAIRAASNRHNPDGRDTIDFTLREHDFEVPVDYREADESAFDEYQIAAEGAKNVIELGKERQIAAIVQNSATYAGGHVITLSGTSKVSNAASSPIKLVSDAVEIVRSKIGFRPRSMWMGASVLAALKTNPEIKASLRLDVNKIPTMEDFKSLFQMDEILVGDAVTAKGDDTFGDIWSDAFGIFYKRPASSARTPNFGYTLRKKGAYAVDRYVEQGGKVEIVRATDIYIPKVTSSEAAFLYLDAV